LHNHLQILWLSGFRESKSGRRFVSGGAASQRADQNSTLAPRKWWLGEKQRPVCVS